MTMTAEIRAEQLAELVKQVQAGNEVLLTQGSKPVAKIVSASEVQVAPAGGVTIDSLKGHRVLTSVIRQADLADEIFSQE
jgi:prevent-host-death family protein